MFKYHLNVLRGDLLSMAKGPVMQKKPTSVGSVIASLFGYLVMFFAVFPFFAMLLLAIVMGTLSAMGIELEYGAEGAATIFALSYITVVVVFWIIGSREDKRYKKLQEYENKKKAEKETILRRFESKSQLDRLAKTAYDNSVKISHEMKNLSELLSSTNLHLKLAVELYQEGKVQLFWSNIEKACIKFAWCWRKVVAISSLTRKHAYLIEEVRSVGGDPRAYSYPFAIFETDRVKSTLLNAANNVVDVMRAAQKNSNAAQMWEHYRTNDSVIGFANLGMFMSNIEEVIANSVELASRDIHNSNRRVEHVIQTVSTSSSRMARASKEQTVALQKLLDCVKKIERDICYQNWEYCAIEPLSPERTL